MMLPLITIALLSLAALLGLWRRRQRGTLGLGRWLFILLAQPVLSVLLYFALFPSSSDTDTHSLTVYTAGAESAPHHAGLAVALPEASQHPSVERVPDLATALRRYPQVQHLHIVGAGLEARDREVARAYSLSLQTQAQTPSGIVALQASSEVALGNVYRIAGRIAGVADANIELFDPAGQRVQQVSPDPQGYFHLQAMARAPGLSTFDLRLLDQAGKVHEELTLPLHVTTPAAPRLLLLATAPSPELKYLRRWAVDAGLSLHSRLGAGAGLMLGDAPIAINTETLRGFDTVLLDQRSLQALSDAEFRALLSAIEEGLGLLVRIDGALAPAEKQRMARLGLALESRTQPRAFLLPSMPSLTASATLAHTATVPETAIALQYVPLSTTTPALVPFMLDRTGQAAGYWRARKRGRVAVVTLVDSYRLVLDGQAAQHASLWSEAVRHVARSLATTEAAAIDLPDAAQHPAWQGERIALCGLDDTAKVLAPDQTQTPVYLDPNTGTQRCAAFWSAQSGWHQVSTATQQQAFYVWGNSEGKALRLQKIMDATRTLVDPTAPSTTDNTPAQPTLAWRWLLAWLLLATAVWWAERRQVTPTLN
jgi:hypothetical protein